MPDDLGLKTAVTTLCREIAEAGGYGEIELHFDDQEAHIPGELKIAVYRILEGFLTPVPAAEAGEDCRRSVGLSASDGRLVLTLQETGLCGTHTKEKDIRDTLLRTVKNRAASFGGIVSEDPGLADGRTVYVIWSLQEYLQE